jgi:16S rRNA (uracil1498-N3)-methyltransferase
VTARRLHGEIGPAGARVALGAGAAKHAKVLRLAAGDAVVVFDGRGGEADATIESVSAGELAVRIGLVRSAPEGPRVVLVQAMPKGAKLDDVVRTATEAGATAIHLAVAERSIARPDDARGEKKIERLAAIAAEAARQCERAHVPQIVAPAPLLEVARRAPGEAAKIVMSPREGARWRDAIGDAREVWIAIGPEGGLSRAEEDALRGIGWVPARIGVPVLRTETAAAIAVALVVDQLG